MNTSFYVLTFSILFQIDRFESSYNFRFEEAGAEGASAQIVGHSRNIANSFRRTDERRKAEREVFDFILLSVMKSDCFFG